jgi:hypothetical protein
MCALIDANCLSKVFDPTNSEHANYLPVWKWINEARGARMIYGGSTYLKGLGRLRRILGLVVELRRKNRVVVLSTADVDTIEHEIINTIGSSGHEDEHLVAIVIVSGCRVVVTGDDAAIQLLKRTELYQGREAKVPRIYQRTEHEHLCCEDNVITVRQGLS